MNEPTGAYVPWRIDCRGCGAWLVTHLPDDITSWVNGHLHIAPEAPPPRWALGWYKTKRHVVDEATAGRHGAAAICSRYTGLYPDGLPNRDYPFPRADEPGVMEKPACKVCLRKIRLTASSDSGASGSSGGAS